MTKEQLRRTVGKNIREMRIARDLTREELSDILKVTPGFLSLIEKGLRGTTLSTLYKLSEIFCEPIGNFFYHAEEPSHSKSQRLCKKVQSLIADFSEAELGYLIHVIKGMNQMKGS